MLSASTKPPAKSTTARVLAAVETMESTRPTCAPPSSRPTRVPDEYLSALAIQGGLRHTDGIPLDLAVPVRLQSKTPPGLDHRVAFLLAHVDDQSSIEQIAKSAQIPAAEAGVHFYALVGAGVIAIGVGVEADALGPPPSSRVVAVSPEESASMGMDRHAVGG